MKKYKNTYMIDSEQLAIFTLGMLKARYSLLDIAINNENVRSDLLGIIEKEIEIYHKFELSLKEQEKLKKDIPNEESDKILDKIHDILGFKIQGIHTIQFFTTFMKLRKKLFRDAESILKIEESDSIDEQKKYEQIRKLESGATSILHKYLEAQSDFVFTILDQMLASKGLYRFGNEEIALEQDLINLMDEYLSRH